jgi:ATP-dependent RNA helicase RhlE
LTPDPELAPPAVLPECLIPERPSPLIALGHGQQASATPVLEQSSLVTSPTFAGLGLPEILSHALTARKFTTPTPIQTDSIPPLLAGRDLLGIAQTGSGKTAAFVLPILAHLLAQPRRAAQFQTRALILAPTRELALQIDEATRSFSAGSGLRTVVIIGGASRFRQCEAMRRGADIVIGTPGRVRDLMNTRELSIATTERFVLDEADRMLDLGFIRDIRHIVAALPVRRQSCLFSATMPTEVASLAAGLLKDPVRVEIARVEGSEPKIEQSVRFVPQPAKQALLTELLGDPTFQRVIVFTRTKHGANKVAEKLEAAGVMADAIHGNKSQPQRERALRDFRTGRARVLVATDIAARGIDVTGVSHVINFDLPAEPESYVHRIGRTARAGAEGVAIAFCDAAERATLRQIEKLLGEKIPVVGDIPQDFHNQGHPQPQKNRRGGPAGRKPNRPQGRQGMRSAA